MSSEYVFSAGMHVVAYFVHVTLFMAITIGGNRKEPVFRWFYFLSLFSLTSFSFDIIVAFMQGKWGFIQGYPSEAIQIISKAVDYIIYISDSLIMFFYNMYLFAFLRLKKLLLKRLTYLTIFFCIMNIAIGTVSLVGGMYGYFDEFNNYQKQDLFWIVFTFPILMLLVGIILTLFHIKALRPREWIVLLIYQIVQIASAYLEATIPDFWISRVTGALMLLLIYITIQVNIMQRVKDQDALLSENRIAIMLSQIQPHFLYNSLASINELCDGNPEAQEAIVQFSRYLRGNMDSLTRRELITFEKELTHTKQYLWLEELRFGPKLQIVYDIQVSDFLLPALSLQPIVENAVRHGITKKLTGGTLTIKTEETAETYRIVVTDDGLGIDTVQVSDEERSHTGISNVRERLSLMCGGILAVASTPDVGTVVTMELPKERSKNLEYYSS